MQPKLAVENIIDQSRVCGFLLTRVYLVICEDTSRFSWLLHAGVIPKQLEEDRKLGVFQDKVRKRTLCLTNKGPFCDRV
jgi:hypothetical protein